MKFTSKNMIIPMAAIALVGAGVYGLASVSAATDTANPHASLIQKLADTFHVDKSKVQAVFDQQKQEDQTARETQYEARLTQAVTDKQITAAQKALIITEHKKLEAERRAAMTAAQNDTSATSADRKLAMDKQRTEIDTWAKANNIDAKWLMGGGMGGPGGRHGGGMMGRGHAGNTTSPSASPSPTPGA